MASNRGQYMCELVAVLWCSGRLDSVAHCGALRDDNNRTKDSLMIGY